MSEITKTINSKILIKLIEMGLEDLKDGIMNPDEFKDYVNKAIEKYNSKNESGK